MRLRSRAEKSRTDRANMRLEIVDVWRGAAVLNMVLFHLAYLPDVMNGYTTAFSAQPAMQLVGHFARQSFMLLAGISLAISRSTAASYDDYAESQWRRVRQIACCAIIVTMVSRALFPKYTIWFGVLHFLAFSIALLYPTVSPSVGLHQRDVWAAFDTNAQMHLAAAFLTAVAFVVIRTRAYRVANISSLPNYTYFVMGWPSAAVQSMDHFAVLKFLPIVLMGLVVGRTVVVPNADLLQHFNEMVQQWLVLRLVSWVGKNSFAIYACHWPAVYFFARRVMKAPEP